MGKHPGSWATGMGEIMGSKQALKTDHAAGSADSAATNADGSEPDVPAGDDGVTLTREDVFEVLSNGRRRCIVHYLKQHRGRRVELRDLVDYVAAWENDTTVEEVSGADRKSVYAAVKQTHLPKLDEAGVVEYDRRSGEVVLTDNAPDVELYLEYEPQDGLAWGKYYLGLSAVGLTLVAISWLDVSLLSLISPEAIALLLAVALAVSATVHVYVAAQQRIGTDEYELDREP